MASSSSSAAAAAFKDEDVFSSSSTLNKPGDRGSRFIQLADDIKEDPNPDMDCLSAEFRHKLGLLPEEEQELSDIFKAKLGLSPLDNDRLTLLIDDREKTTGQYSMEKFALNHFQTQPTMRKAEVKYMEGQLSLPLLPKETVAETQASIYLFAAIKKFMEKDFPSNSSKNSTKNKPYMPVLMKVFQVLDSFQTDGNTSPTSPTSAHNTPGLNQAKQEEKPKKAKNKLTIKKLIRTIGKAYSKRAPLNSASNEDASAYDNPSMAGKKSGSVSSDHSGFNDHQVVTYESLIKSLACELEIVQFILSHGIIRKDLRDEIYCQLCCQVSNNPSVESMERGWILHSLCISSFLPSAQLIGYYVSFLQKMSDTSPIVVDRIFQNILRTNENGFRYHPANSLELKAELEQKPVLFQIALVDGRVIRVSVDSSCTSLEVCSEIARQINLEDSFGFSLYISIYEKVSSLGCGSDHVMDAITECEHMARDRGVEDETKAPWKLFYRKELFTPWFDPKLDPVSTNLIYRQICDGFKNEELKVPQGIVDTVIAQILFVETGPLNPESIRLNLSHHCPKSLVPDDTTYQNLCFSVYQIAHRLALDTDDNTKTEIKNNIVTSASQFLCMNFSALFEAVNFGAFPQLPPQEVIIALNGCGVTIMSNSTMAALAYFKFCDLLFAYTNRATEIASSVLTLVAVDGVEYSLGSPNSEVAAKIIVAFLSGLRRRSRWAVAIKPFMFKDFRKNKDMKEFELAQGDTVELLDEIFEGTLNRHEVGQDILYGICERTGLRGYFPVDVVYVIPTANRPPQDFLDTLQLIGKEVAQSTKAYYLKSRVIMSDADTIKRHPDSSA